MAISWYYVEGSDRIGPIIEDNLKELLLSNKLDKESYVWRKGFENWAKIGELDELEHLFDGVVASKSKESSSAPVEMKIQRPVSEEEVSVDSTSKIQISSIEEEEVEVEEVEEEESSEQNSLELPPIKEFSWDNYSVEESIFSVKIGADRESNFVEYGPYSMNMIKRLFKEKRISPKTFIFTPGMKDWMFIANIPEYSNLFMGVPPVIDDEQRRADLRRPFVARMLIHDNQDVYEGICRDISVGGVQVLVSGMDVSVGDMINMNVHPDNSNYCFVASGKVVRVLDGKQGFSLRFNDLSQEAFSSIGQYVEAV